MSSIDVLNEISSMQTATAVTQAAEKKETGASQEMNQDMFLSLMLEQLKYQDPMEPMSNTEFLSQQAQFTQVSELQELNASLSQNNYVMQTLALVGKEVTITDPNNTKETITGKVTEAPFSGDSSAIVINGKSYPMSLIQSVKEASSTAN
jgi:flagellar basal-body rod modification protein FlgD